MCSAGLVAGIAGILYAAHLGQARPDAGTGYELDAITAVVFGGTSVFGGRGTVWGTLRRIVRDRVVAEWAASGGAAVRAHRRARRRAAHHHRSCSIAAAAASAADIEAATEDETTVRNSQVAILCAAVVLGAF